MASYLSPTFIRHILIVTLIGTVLVGVNGCDTSLSHQNMQKVQNQYGDIYIDDEEVQVTDQHLASIKPKLYQPRLTLFGQLKPLQTTIIVSPQRAHIQQIFVHTGNQVLKGDTLFSYTPPPIEVIIEDEPSSFVDNISPTAEEIKQLALSSQNLTATQSEKLIIDTNDKQSNNQTKVETINPETINSGTVNDAVEGKSEANIILSKAEIMKAPFTGRISEIYYSNLRSSSDYLDMTIIEKNTPLMKLETSDSLYFVSVFPEYTRSKLSIGQHVNLVAQKEKEANNQSITHLSTQPNNNINIIKNSASEPDNDTWNRDDLKLTGQISDIQTINDYEIQVNVNVLPNENHDILTPDIFVQGRVDYGQMEVGTLVDESGVFETPKSNLNIFKLPEPHVSAPIEAYVWIVGHDKKIRRLSVYVISYDINTKQYLVSDVPSEVMIILADLAETANGKTLKVQ